MNERETYGWSAEDPVPYVVAEVSGAELLAEIREVRAEIAELRAVFDQAAGQINAIAELAGPTIEQLTSSPWMRMLAGGKRDKSRSGA